jgi:gliding motility-associated protein GldM
MTFQTLPLVAVICILSELQLSVRNGETEVLNTLYSQIDASSYKFNRLKPVVIPNSKYVTQGSDYEAQVFISATDTTQKLSITVGGAELPIDETGKGIYKVRTSSTGPKKWGGVIILKAPDGTVVPYSFSDEYTVGEPNVVVSPTAMNVLYTGIENPLDVSVPNVSPDKIKINKVINGDYKTGKVKNSKGEYFRGNYIIVPKAAGQNVQVFVTADMNGKPMQFDPILFRVKPVPPPIAQFAKRSTGTVPRATAAAQQGVFAVQPDFDFDLQYQVTGFTILYSDSRGDFEAASTNSNLTTQQKDLIGRLTRGKYLTIKDITARGPDGKTLELLPVILKID